jgi:hypothetical protein
MLKYILLFLLIPTLCFADGYIIGWPTAGASSTCTGWTSSVCVPDGTPASTVSNITYTATRTWTAAGNGTAKTIQFYAGATRWAPAQAWVVLYRNIGGTITLVGKGVTSGVSAGTWSGKVTLIVEGGQTLAFSTNDVLYFGVAWHDTTNSQYIGRNDTGGAGMFWNGTDVETGPLATLTWTTSAGREMGYVLEYE